MQLIYCANGNRRFMTIARECGWEAGARLPGTLYECHAPLAFADQDWRQPDRAAYMAALALHRPHMASVLDLERRDQLSEVLDWAEEAAQYTARVMIIPKAHGIIRRLPRQIGGADVLLGYSVPTRHGGTSVWPAEFDGWPIHLLGGSPQAQMRHAARMRGVVSADGNMSNKMATTWGAYWTPGTSTDAKDRYWQKLPRGTPAAPYEARRSCVNIMAAWEALKP